MSTYQVGSLRVCAFDPGGHTGIAQRTPDGISTAVALTAEEVVTYLRDGNWDRVVYERFASSVATSHDAIWTIEMCGLIQGIAMALGLVLIRHVPANRNAFMKQATQWIETSRADASRKKGAWAVHETDALAHLLADEHFGDELAGPASSWGKGLSTNAS